MRLLTRATTAAAVLLAMSTQLAPVSAMADPEDPTSAVAPAPPQPAPGPLSNITYRARIDGVSRGATITYEAEGNQLQTANPTMIPGRTFEAQTVLPDTGTANMRVSIRWPYSANLHCEILVNDAIVAQADDFISPRALPVNDDPDYGALTCEAPVAGVPMPAVPADAPPPDGPPPADAPPAAAPLA
ncbi:MAG: hypothetical protein ABWY93_19320 [Mycobacterium sp.]